MDGAVSDTTAVERYKVVLYHVAVTVIGAARENLALNFATSLERYLGDTGITVTVIEVFAHCKALEGVCKGRTSNVGQHSIDTCTVRAHSFNLAIAEDSVLIVDIIILLACIEDVNPALGVSLAFFVGSGDIGIYEVEAVVACAHAHIIGENLGALGKFGGVEKLHCLDVATFLGVVDGGRGFGATYLYVKIGVFETAVFAVDVKPCGNLNFLRADVFEFHGLRDIRYCPAHQSIR